MRSRLRRCSRCRFSPAIAGRGNSRTASRPTSTVSLGSTTARHCATRTRCARRAADYVGETTYYWDADAKRVAFLYIENLGGVSRGTMEPVANGFVFPPTRYVAGSEAMTYRVRWTRQGDDAYEAFSEMQGKDGWTTMFKLLLKRMPS
jgi:hypothetical protein